MKNLFDQLDKAFENKIRLSAMTILMANNRASFNDLKEILKVTDGNLASHLKYLEKEAYIEVSKSFINRKPNTIYSITEKGKKSFEKHLSALEEIIKHK